MGTPSINFYVNMRLSIAICKIPVNGEETAIN